MQAINQVTAALMDKSKQSQQQPVSTIDAKQKKPTEQQIINLKSKLAEVFARMKTNWGYRLKDEYTTTQFVDDFAASILESEPKPSPELFEASCVAAMDSTPGTQKFPDVGVIGFLQAGQRLLAKSHGFLSAEQSFEAIFDVPAFAIDNPQYKCDIVTWNAVCRVGAARLQTASQQSTKPLYLKAYAEVLNLVTTGDIKALVANGTLRDLPPPEQAQIADKGASKEFALNALEKIKQQQGWA